MKKLLALLLCLTLGLPLPLLAQTFPPLSVSGPEIPGNNYDDDGDGVTDEIPATSIVVDANAAGNYHWHFRNCEKVTFANVADTTFPDSFRVEKPVGSTIIEGEIVCYIPNLPANTYTLHLQYSTPRGTQAIWPGVNKSLRYQMKPEEASILPFIDTPQWQYLVYTGTAANYYAGTNGGDGVSFVWPGGSFAIAFKADDIRLACGYLAIGAAPVRICPGETGTPLLADYEMLELGGETAPTAWNSAAFTHANTMSFTGSEVGTVCGGSLTVKGLWDNTTTDRQYFSINCADTDDETVTIANDDAGMPSANQDQVDIRWRANLSAVLDTDTYMVIGNLQPVYFDADWSGTANARNPAVNLNTTVVRNVVSSTSWNLFIATDIGSNIAPDTFGLFNLAVQDKDTGVSGAFKYFHGTSVLDMAQWGVIKWSNTAVKASGGGGDVTAPVVTSPAIPAGTVEQTSFIMTANTNEDGTCRVHWGTSAGVYTASGTGVPSVNGVCTASAGGLIAGTTYHAEMRVEDAAGNIGDSTNVETKTSTGAVTDCTHYASQAGGGDGSSEAKPFQIVNFLGVGGVATAGKVLCLLDGTYTGTNSMIKPRTDLSGNKLAPIKVKALNDGAVFINGQYLNRPVEMGFNNDWWIIEGINAGNSAQGVVTAGGGSENITFRRICAWNAHPDRNVQIFSIHSSNNTIEDSCAFGGGRKLYTNSQGGNNLKVRRSFGIWKSHNYTGPNMVFGNVYNSYGALFENNIAMWNGPSLSTAFPSGGGSNQPYGCYAQDRLDAAPWETNSKFLASMCILRSSDNVSAGMLGLLHLSRSADGSTLQDMIVFIDPASHAGVRAIIVQPFDQGAGGTSDCPNTADGICTRILDSITKIGVTRADSISASTSTTSDLNSYANLAAMPGSASPFQITPGTGARMCLRMVDGQLTSEKLAFAHMNARIIAAMTLAGETPVDVTATVEAKFGTIPAACKS